METLLTAIGWIAYAITIYLFLSFSYGVRLSRELSTATALSALGLFVLVLLPLMPGVKLLHLLWLLPTVILFAGFLLSIPVVGSLLAVLARLFARIVRVGTGRQNRD